jgi:hypothetical protein
VKQNQTWALPIEPPINRSRTRRTTEKNHQARRRGGVLLAHLALASSGWPAAVEASGSGGDGRWPQGMQALPHGGVRTTQSTPLG